MVSLAIMIAVGVAVGGLLAGYRPVIILTGSMGETAPPGSMIITRPVDGDAIEVGDIVTMRRPNGPTVTHRVLEIESNDIGRFAITKGDANETIDAAPHPLTGDQLVTRWVLPGVGTWAQKIFRPGLTLGLVGLATLVMATGALRRIWASPASLPAPPDPANGTGQVARNKSGDASPNRTAKERSKKRRGSSKRKRRVAMVPMAVVATSAGVAWALAAGIDNVDGNSFGTSDCFDARLGSIQSGETTHATNGTVNVPITAVDPTRSFVIASMRSDDGAPADSQVLVELGGGGSSVDLHRPTTAVPQPAITVSWSVVEYSCGVTVQRGSVVGNGTAQIDIPITTVDTAASFILANQAAVPSAANFAADDVYIAEFTDASTLSIRITGATFSPSATFGWQVIEFDDSADASVQTISTTLGVGVASANIAIPSPVDTRATFLLAGANSSSSGADIGERLIRANLVDGSTVAVSRGVAGDAIEVQVQVVTLQDGSTVRHGTVDLAASAALASITIDPVDPNRSTAFSTVMYPGLVSGGQSDYVADDVAGEAMATFEVTDATTVTVTRDATTSNASFGWQVVEWAGPGWWDSQFGFRQRIDVATSTAAAPDGYTVPLVFDHAALVSSGLSEVSGDDVRVLRWDGATWTELDRVLEDGSAWNQPTTNLWFRTSSGIAADSIDSYWLYFGDSTPSAPPADPEAVYLLTENFDSGTLGDFEDRTAGGGWYQALPWTRRIPVTVPAANVAADLTDYPLLVTLTSADLAANAQVDGSDIRFTAADGLTSVPHEIESWDSGSGALTAWVLVPSVTSATDTTVYLYYGAADAPDQQDVRSTWPAPHRAVWHLSRDPSGAAPQLDDSSVGNHDGLSAGAMSTADLVAGAAGSAIDFDGTDDVLRADPFELTGATSLTVSALVRLDAYTTDARVVTKASDGSSRVVELMVDGAGTIVGRLTLDGSLSAVQGGTVPTGAWHHLAMTWDGSTQRLYLDGSEVASAAASGAVDSGPAMPFAVGNLAAGGAPLDGLVDEVRVETTVRPATWLAALQANLRSPGTFLTLGSVETGTWFGQGTWSRRKPLVLDSGLVGADQTEYPLLVQFTDVDMAAGATIDGRDLVFTASDGTTRLDHAIEDWDQGTGALSAWVLVPTLSSSVDTEIYLYYGNTTAINQQDPPAVFGSEADLVLTGGS